MKKISLLVTLLFNLYVGAQKIENINYYLENQNIIITYDFINCNNKEKFDISVIFADQNQTKITPISLSGDLKKISCGSKRIVWNILKDELELSGKYQVWLDFKISGKTPIEIEWVKIPSGTFKMGSINETYMDETQHQVTLSSFKMSKNEITFDQYDLFCDRTGREKPSDEGWGRGSRPVINVSWDDASAFANWMGCRLPTEAEWEYACRAGTTTPFNTGDNLTINQANFNGEPLQDSNPEGRNLQKTLPVGSYSSNSWGLNDMHGNVTEWCIDAFANYTNIPQTNPIGSSSRVFPVIRGGSWHSIATDCRSASRSYAIPSERNNSFGFRIVISQ